MRSPYLMMIDDDPDDYEILKASLSACKDVTEVVYANDADTAIARLEKEATTHNLPALILLDLNMPRISGTETLNRLRKIPDLVKVPVIILSTSINPVERDKCLTLGATDYLVKPVSRQEALHLAERIEKFLRASRA